MVHLTPDEVNQRRMDLREMRELAFRADKKAKRVAKIKSKTFRKLQKKARAKEEERLKAAGLGEEEQVDQMQREVDRARARATLRHRNSSKWSRSLRDEDQQPLQRNALMAQLDREEDLRNKILGADSETKDSDGDDTESDGEEEASARADALKNLSDIHLNNPSSSTGEERGVFAMKFMKEAEERRESEIRREIHDLQRGLHIDSDGNDSESEEGTTIKGRKLTFAPSNPVS